MPLPEVAEAVQRAHALKARQDAEVERRIKWAGVREQIEGMTDSEVYVANSVLEALLGGEVGTSSTKLLTSHLEPPPLPEPPPEAPQRSPVRREPPNRSEGEQGPGALEL